MQYIPLHSDEYSQVSQTEFREKNKEILEKK